MALGRKGPNYRSFELWGSFSSRLRASNGEGMAEADSTREGRVCEKTPDGAPDVRWLEIDRQPSAAQALRDIASHVASGEGIQDEVTLPREELDEESWNLAREPRRVRYQAVLTAIVLIAVPRRSVRHVDQIWWDGAAIVAFELLCHMPRGALPTVVPVLQQQPHIGRVRT